jgi:hypothetical protein
MIIALSVFLVLLTVFSIYTFLEGRKNKKAILEILCPEIEIQKTRIEKIMKKL